MSEQPAGIPLSQLRARFASKAVAAFDRMFGSDGQNGLVTFDQREQRACEVTDELSRWLMAKIEYAGANEVPFDQAAESLGRLAVATMQPVEAFGGMIGGEAQRRGFYQAQRPRGHAVGRHRLHAVA